MEKFGKDSKYADMFKVNDAGEREFIGTEQDAEDLRDAYIAESEASLEEAEADAEKANKARDNIKKSAENGSIATELIDEDVTWADIEDAYGSENAKDLETITGKSRADINELNKKSDAA
jgi:hypothetical protein